MGAEVVRGPASGYDAGHVDAAPWDRTATAGTSATTSISHRWRTRMTAVRGAGDESWRPSSQSAETALRTGALLRGGDDRYVIQFEVAGGGLAIATRAAMAKWARIHELCSLPDWPLITMTVEEVDTR